MNLTTKGKYAVTAALDLAMHQGDVDSYTKISDVADRQSIPASYLEQIFSNLRRVGILQAARGPKGGFKLARPSNEVMIGEIINAVERNMDATQCSGEGICNSGTKCIAHNFWIDFNDNVNEFLMTRSLEDVITQRRGGVEQMGKALIATG